MREIQLVMSLVGCLLMRTPVTKAQCPTLPSGFCFVDCTRTVYRIACEFALGSTLSQDILVYSNTSQFFELYVWNSNVTGLTSSMIAPVANQLVRLDLDNLLELKHFPELRRNEKLKQVTIMNSPQLTYLPAELLPESLESLTLHQLGIRELVNDFDEVQTLPNLVNFSISGSKIIFIQKNFFSLFPKLRIVRLRNNVFSGDRQYRNLISFSNPLDVLEIVQNNMQQLAYSRRRSIIDTTLRSVCMAKGGRFDFSDNELPITEEAANAFALVSNVSFFSIRNNQFEDYISLIHAFKGFDELLHLDMSGTNLLKSRGMLAGLPKLLELRLSNNSFRDLITIDLFEDCKATNLRLLDLSGNHIRLLPNGLSKISQQLTHLNISYNEIDLDVVHDHKSFPAVFHAFPKLRNLDLSFNHLGLFNGSVLTELTQLEVLNISCNNFAIVTKDFFAGLSASLKTLNMSFCAETERKAPFIELDAFSTLPVNIKTLVLSTGFLTSSVFNLFKNASIASLEYLDLTHNVIADLPSSDILVPLSSLKSIRFRYNQLQSVGAQGFAALTGLEELDLSQNEISSIGAHDFDGLVNLQLLSLSGNNIVDVDPDALEPLVNLKLFYFGKNHFANIKPIFGDSGSNVRHLGLQYLPASCLDPELFSLLKSIRWIYLNQSQPIYADFGSFRNIRDEMTKDPPAPEPFRVASPHERGCEAEYLFNEDPDASIRILVQDTKNQVAQHVILTFPICHITKTRRMRELATNLICKQKMLFPSISDADSDDTD